MARASIEEKVAALGDLSRPELVELWIKRFGCPPPLGVRQPLLVRAAAWDLQERQLGGLSTHAKRLLKAAVKRASKTVEEAELLDGAANPGIPRAEVERLRSSSRSGSRAKSWLRPVSRSGLEPASGPMNGPAYLSTLVLEGSGAHRSIPLPGARLIREWNGQRYVVEVVDGGFVMDGVSYRSLTSIAFKITGARWSGPRFFGL